MISQGAAYAITALGYIASAGGRPVLVKQIARAAEIPPAYLAKLIHALARRGFVNTQRGVGGGVVLALSPEKISLHDLCVALDDPIVLPTCMLGNAECSDARSCPAHQFWTVQRQQLYAFLQNTSVADIAAFESTKRWIQLGLPGISAIQAGPRRPAVG
jgi:Rrf2 family protein